jgi:predicted Rossmann fold flavoprotein
MPIKTERGNRVFPVSDHSSDVIATLKRELETFGVTVKYHVKVQKLSIDHGEVKGVLLSDGKRLSADALIVATGGCSYTSTGSTGDGYRFATDAGHTIATCRPSLVPFTASEDYVKELMGLSLKNVKVTIKDKRRILFEDFGEMLFTHFGVSGPLILSASSHVNDALGKEPLQMEIDLKPALTMEQLDKRILHDFEEAKNKQFSNSISKLYPSKMIPVMIRLSGIHPDKKVNEITKEERSKLAECTKAFPVTLTGLKGFEEAIITRGGVSVKEINPSTMESKLVKNLFFAGEVIDADAVTGGFNLQIAWSTGYLAGNSIN